MRRVPVGDFATTPKMRAYVNDVLDSGQISYGKYSRQFEKEFARLHGCEYGVLSNSGTDALRISLQAMSEEYDWRPGDRVIVPMTTFVSTANVVTQNRLVPLFVDVDKRTYNLDPDKLSEIKDDRVRAVIPVHLFGQPANMTRIREICINRGWKILEDSCEAMFCTHHSKPVGSWGDMAGFSGYVAHLVVMGVGGIITTNNPALAARARSISNHGLDIQQLDPDNNFSPRAVPGRRFRFTSIGYSSRLTEMEAALGLSQIEGEQIEMVAKRNAVAAQLTEMFEDINRKYGDDFQLPFIESNNTSSWMMFPLVLNKKGRAIVDKEPLMKHLNDNGIETRDMLPIIGQPAYRYVDPYDFPISNWLVKSGFYIGCLPSMGKKDVAYVHDVVCEFTRNG